MAINQKDIKLLWGRSGNRCSQCKVGLTQDKSSVSASFTLGEQAHIVGEKENAARGRSSLTTDERNSYHNLILLCPNCHTVIDENEIDWSVERLHKIKSEHELWVSETLSETVDHVKLAKDTAVAAIVDAAVNLCGLDDWDRFSRAALSVSPSWSGKLIEDVAIFRKRMIGAIWPTGFEEFRRATLTLAIYFHRASEKFLEHAESVSQGRWRVVKFYKIRDPNPNYHADLERYEIWLEECYELVYLTAKAANWFSDVVRRDINPLFFLEKGRFLVEEGPFEDFSIRTGVLSFTDIEKEGLPKKALSS